MVKVMVKGDKDDDFRYLWLVPFCAAKFRVKGRTTLDVCLREGPFPFPIQAMRCLWDRERGKVGR